MLNILRRGASAPETVTLAEGWTLPDDTVWIDLIKPTREEELAIEKASGVQVPTREEMSEIETSSRHYQENGATFMMRVSCVSISGRDLARYFCQSGSAYMAARHFSRWSRLS